MGATEQLIWTWVAAVMTLAIYSFLYKDNPLYKFAEHLLVGTSVGYSIAAAYSLIFKPQVIDGLLNPDTTLGTKLLRVVPPVLLGLCYFSYFIPKYTWISRYPIAFIMGYSAGFALPRTIVANVFRQLRGTFAQEIGGQMKPLLSWTNIQGFFHQPTAQTLFDAVYGPLLIIGVVSVMIIFIFSVEHRGPMKAVSKVGMFYLMIGFGAAFGFTVMARISLLVGRVDFLLGDWLGIL